MRRSDKEARAFASERDLIETLGGQLVAWELSEFPGPWWGQSMAMLPRRDGTDRWGPHYDTSDGKPAGPVGIRPHPRPESAEARRWRLKNARGPS